MSSDDMLTPKKNLYLIVQKVAELLNLPMYLFHNEVKYDKKGLA